MILALFQYTFTILYISLTPVYVQVLVKLFSNKARAKNSDHF